MQPPTVISYNYITSRLNQCLVYAASDHSDVGQLFSIQLSAWSCTSHSA